MFVPVHSSSRVHSLQQSTSKFQYGITWLFHPSHAMGSNACQAQIETKTKTLLVGGDIEGAGGAQPLQFSQLLRLNHQQYQTSSVHDLGRALSCLPPHALRFPYSPSLLPIHSFFAARSQQDRTSSLTSTGVALRSMRYSINHRRGRLSAVRLS